MDHLIQAPSSLLASIHAGTIYFRNTYCLISRPTDLDMSGNRHISGVRPSRKSRQVCRSFLSRTSGFPFQKFYSILQILVPYISFLDLPPWAPTWGTNEGQGCSSAKAVLTCFHRSGSSWTTSNCRLLHFTFACRRSRLVLGKHWPHRGKCQIPRY